MESSFILTLRKFLFIELIVHQDRIPILLLQIIIANLLATDCSIELAENTVRLSDFLSGFLHEVRPAFKQLFQMLIFDLAYTLAMLREVNGN